MPELTVRTVRHELRVALRAAWGDLHVREIVLVRLAWSDRDYGEGEAAPLEPYDGVSLAAVRAALDAYAQVLREEPTLEACRRERDLPQALAAIDLALWDREVRRTGTPLARLLDPDPLREIAVNATVGAEDRATAAAEAAAAVARGYRTLKVKVGVGDDAGRLAAVRAVAGRGVALRADANGAWR